jgi:eukaryotic-like serine/threonine-protein kinase
MDCRDAANRDLLIGLFALQNGLVDQSVLVAAFQVTSALTGDQTFFRACCHACVSGLAGRPGAGRSAESRSVEVDLAMHWLRPGLARGSSSLEPLKNESGLYSLRSRQDFQMLMLDVAFPADPFARGD